jgi:hypothetical protein
MYPNKKFDIAAVKKVAENSTSRIYGMILYTRKDAYVIKVLKDEDFWNSFDEISGPNWPIFTTEPLTRGHYTISNTSSDSISFMVQKWQEPNINWDILDTFGLSSSEDLPCFVAFMWDDNDNLHEAIMPIRGRGLEETYNSIKNIIEVISKAEEQILDEYKQSESVFREVKSNLEAAKFKNNIVKCYKALKEVKDILPFV